MSGDIRRVPVAVSVDAMMHQWARQESAPAGSALVAEAEISARLRGGALWRTSGALAAAVLARPAELEPSGMDLAWLAASLGAARALDTAAGGEHRCEWPDAVLAGSGAEVAVSAICTLGPGRVDYAILIVRLGPADAFVPPVNEGVLVGELRVAARLLDEPGELVDVYRRRCATVGCTAAVALLPHGAVRGRVRGISADGRLEVESPTGLVERIAVSSFSSLRRLED